MKTLKTIAAISALAINAHGELTPAELAEFKRFAEEADYSYVTTKELFGANVFLFYNGKNGLAAFVPTRVTNFAEAREALFASSITYMICADIFKASDK